MVQITQTDEEIKIIIELNRLITRKPDIVLLPTYLKFNNPPIFFERHLAQEVDELGSFCRIFKNEARIILIKKQKGMWPELFLKLSKEDLMKKRLEIADIIVERNKERDKQTIERYEQKRRNEIEKEVRRESAMRERVKQFEKNACREALMIGGKETHTKPKSESRPSTARTTAPSAPIQMPQSSPTPPALMQNMAAPRNNGKISVCFSNFSMITPKRESTTNIKMPFTISDPNDNNNEKIGNNSHGHNQEVSTINDPE